jgi:hypothetical protein
MQACRKDTLIRDHWAGYEFFSGPQGFCNANHLRELTAVAETYPGHTWPERMIALLCEGKQAEPDIRMHKLKQKVSSCFRSATGAAAFVTVRSYLSTLRKQSVDSLQALIMTFEGNPPMRQLG